MTQTTDAIDRIAEVADCDPSLVRRVLDMPDAPADSLAEALDCRESVIDRIREGAADALVPCECGQVTGEPCAWTGPIDETVVIEWVPRSLRASHSAAGGRGASVPHNGAERLRVEASCADRILKDDGDGEWTRIV